MSDRIRSFTPHSTWFLTWFTTRFFTWFFTALFTPLFTPFFTPLLHALIHRGSSCPQPSMKTQFYTASTLDGFIATEDDSLDWLFALGDPTDSTYPQFIEGVGAIAMGSVTYEWILAHSTEMIGTTGSAWPYTQPTWVFTHRKLKPVPGADIRFASGDVREVHAAMRAAAGDRNLWVAGGGELVGQFHDAGLLDEIIVQIGSATLAGGKPLLPRRILPPRLRLTSVQRIGAEFVELRYTVVPDPRTPA